MRTPWRFHDPRTSENYFLPVNPNEDQGGHGINKVTKYEAAASTYQDELGEIRVNDVVMAGAPDDVVPFSYSGFIYTKDQYDGLVNWFAKDYPWEIRDDLGREFLIYVDKFSKERVRSRQYRWKHSYQFSGIVLQELGL